MTAIDWEPLIPLIGKANRSLAYYDGILYAVSNPQVLLSPLTTQEAVISSKIEGTQATLGEVLKFEAGEAPQKESRRLDIEEILNYRKAMRMAEDHLRKRPFSLNLVKQLHSILLTGVRGHDKAKGQFRCQSPGSLTQASSHSLTHPGDRVVLLLVPGCQSSLLGLLSPVR